MLEIICISEIIWTVIVFGISAIGIGLVILEIVYIWVKSNER